jgi:hypothetical protein
MKIIKVITIMLVIFTFNSQSFSEEIKRDCSEIKADTGVKMYEKLRCKMGKEKGEGLGNTIKNLFKKKS